MAALAAAVLLVLGGVVQVTAAADQGKAAYEQKCFRCHDSGRIVKKARSADEWRSIVNKMKGKSSSGISDADAEAIIGYLSENLS